MVKEITEEMNLQVEWYKQAKEQTVETLPKFIRHLTEDFCHDYGTIVHAMASAALATIWAMDKTDQGRITGSQANALQSIFIEKWSKE